MKQLALAAVVLAAGRSRRLGQFKPLLQIEGRSLLERAVAVFRQNRVADIVVVTGHRSAEVRSMLKSETVRIARNERYDRGMFSSVQVGVRHLTPGFEAFFILPVDHALIQPATVGRLIDAYQDQPGRICHPCAGGRRGHPPLIPARLAQEIADYGGKGGLRRLLQRHDHLALDVHVADRGTIIDIDTPADLTRLR